MIKTNLQSINMFQPPGSDTVFQPPSGDWEGIEPINIPSSIESERTVPAYVVKSRAIRSATSKVIKTRKDFVTYLRNAGLDLVTSWIEFQTSKDFIASSYVVYPKHGNIKEPLGQFLVRYPHLKPQVETIRDNLTKQFV